MQFDLTKAKFIPQSNVRDVAKLSMDALIPYVPKSIPVEYDLVLLKNGSWKIADRFVEGQAENEGFTASLVEGSVFLIKGNETLSPELTPKFLNGAGTVFKSAFFTFIVSASGIDLNTTTEFFLEEGESGIEDVKVYLLSTTAPVVQVSDEILPTENVVFEDETEAAPAVIEKELVEEDIF